MEEKGRSFSLLSLLVAIFDRRKEKHTQTSTVDSQQLSLLFPLTMMVYCWHLFRPTGKRRKRKKAPHIDWLLKHEAPLCDASFFLFPPPRIRVDLRTEQIEPLKLASQLSLFRYTLFERFPWRREWKRVKSLLFPSSSNHPSSLSSLLFLSSFVRSRENCSLTLSLLCTYSCVRYFVSQMSSSSLLSMPFIPLSSLSPEAVCFRRRRKRLPYSAASQLRFHIFPFIEGKIESIASPLKNGEREALLFSLFDAFIEAKIVSLFIPHFTWWDDDDVARCGKGKVAEVDFSTIARLENFSSSPVKGDFRIFQQCLRVFASCICIH